MITKIHCVELPTCTFMFSEILWIAYDIFCGPKIEHYTTDEFKITNLKITVARSV